MDDKSLRRRIIDALDREPTINAALIGVAVENGVVTLTGHVGSPREKEVAERIVRRVKGVRAVEPDIEVRAPGTTESDEEIARRARVVIAWHAHLEKHTVDVAVAKGWVTLTGTVAEARERKAAEEAVRKLDGVTGVTNLIEVRNG